MNADLHISDNGIEFMKAREGCVLHQYLDTAGKWTWGIGHLLSAAERVASVFQGEATIEFVEDVFLEDIASRAHAINTLVTAPLNQNQFDALVSFVFNVGVNSFSSSTLLKYLNAGNYQDAASQFLVWDKEHIDGVLVFSQGILNRRHLELQLFNTPISTSSAA